MGNNMEEYTIVRHKLTKKKFLVLSYNEYGSGYIPKTRVRGNDYKEYFFDTKELEEIKIK